VDTARARCTLPLRGQDHIELDTRDKKAGSRPKRQTQLESLLESWRNRTILTFEKPKEKPQVVLRERHKRERTKKYGRTTVSHTQTESLLLTAPPRCRAWSRPHAAGTGRCSTTR